MWATHRCDWDIDAFSLGQMVWVPFVIIICGRIADGYSGFAWAEFLLLALSALALPVLVWGFYRFVQKLF